MPRALVLLAAGGTGGHLFPAQALADALNRRGIEVDLATDERATRYGQDFPARETHVIPSATIRGRDPISLARTAGVLGLGAMKALLLLRRIRPAAVVGFGGYPTLPPVLAATLRRIPTVIHDANAVLGRANKLLSSRVTAIATSFPGVALDAPLAAKATFTGNPVRPMVIAAAVQPYAAPEVKGSFRLLITGGSQGARVMADVVPAAIARLAPELRVRLAVVQQARPEDEQRVRETYAQLGVNAEVAPFFADLPARIADAHLVVSRSGASTVAELAAIGRPSILVPLPHALDQDQLANANVLGQAGGTLILQQDDFTAERLAGEIAGLAAEPAKLSAMAVHAKSAGVLDAADRLADLVMKIAIGAANREPS
ncbi:MAG: undecaprenyldiphospho-muramoylpentapeptide beta-N-acetylglucosaminyltransferase [Alphaproteobacteria bacterium]|nr:MAG: undecaprenyldiphospho-muramoylpentapeptide beta-N-acetylglucosaminyltransferase [Alphaproteobacteria bacterium]